jgi:hypothetical protein
LQGSEVRPASRLFVKGTDFSGPGQDDEDDAAYSPVARGQSCPSPRPQQLFSEPHEAQPAIARPGTRMNASTEPRPSASGQRSSAAVRDKNADKVTEPRTSGSGVFSANALNAITNQHKQNKETYVEKVTN